VLFPADLWAVALIATWAEKYNLGPQAAVQFTYFNLQLGKVL
jgi:hypothetical protein